MKRHFWISLVVLAVIAVIAVIIAAYAPAWQPTQAQATGPAEPAAGVSNETPLLFLGNQNLAPIVYLDGTTPSGVDIDIVHALAQHMPQPIEIRVMNWTEAQTLVANGDADALIQINPTEEREKIYDFSDPLLESHFSIFTRTDQTGISGLSSLRGLRVGVESGGLPQQLLEPDPQVQLTIISDFTEAFKQLHEGSLDAVVVDYRVGSYVLAENNIPNIKVSGEPIDSTNSSFAVKKGNTILLNEINDALQIIKSDGTYQKIIDKWQPTESVFETQQQITDRNYPIIIFILLLLFLIAVIWMLTIKKELSKRKAAEEDLRKLYAELEQRVIERTSDLKLAQEALYQVNKKLNILSSITRHDIRNQLSALKSYLALSKETLNDTSRIAGYIQKEETISDTIERQINFTGTYQDMGVTAPAWQNVQEGVLRAVAALPMRDVKAEVDCTDLEVYADPLFEKVSYNLIDNALRYGGDRLTKIHITSQETDAGLVLYYENDGAGISPGDKKHLFEQGFGKNTGLGLFLSREILSITGITIIENGETGKGARFEITVPKGAYRFTGSK
ncbi:MAG: transporter substrate-binding domain-containing protein [Methanoregula sp.]|jgi:ABC-type amino acid transport substrate-binding protein|uniref:transporter substrate-binding domain-containing protein n=1 Tax=Methanoregula sp. TaxID=2052170 RepID=UPI003C272B49